MASFSQKVFRKHWILDSWFAEQRSNQKAQRNHMLFLTLHHYSRGKHSVLNWKGKQSNTDKKQQQQSKREVRKWCDFVYNSSWI